MDPIYEQVSLFLRRVVAHPEYVISVSLQWLDRCVACNYWFIIKITFEYFTQPDWHFILKSLAKKLHVFNDYYVYDLFRRSILRFLRFSRSFPSVSTASDDCTGLPIANNCIQSFGITMTMASPREKSAYKNHSLCVCRSLIYKVHRSLIYVLTYIANWSSLGELKIHLSNRIIIKEFFCLNIYLHKIKWIIILRIKYVMWYLMFPFSLLRLVIRFAFTFNRDASVPQSWRCRILRLRTSVLRFHSRNPFLSSVLPFLRASSLRSR